MVDLVFRISDMEPELGISLMQDALDDVGLAYHTQVDEAEPMTCRMRVYEQHRDVFTEEVAVALESLGSFVKFVGWRG